MGAVGGLLGLGGGASGTGFNVNPGTNPEQLGTAYQGVQNSLQGQQALLNALQQQGGLQNQSNVYGQLQDIVAGRGPNPAQAMLSQATGQNVANQAALMAGQRGAAANVGLMARQAAQQGANLQQQAAGQGATIQAQQALNALGSAGNLATQMAGQQINQANQNVSSQQNEQNILQGANTAQNQANAALAQQQMQNQPLGLGGLGNAIGAGIGLLGKKSAPALTSDLLSTAAPLAVMAADGGQIPQRNGPVSILGRHLNMASGGQVPAMVSPGEAFVEPQNIRSVAQGKMSPLEAGETFPGKAKVKGDSYQNDIVRRNLPEGGIVIPRSVMNSKNPEREAASFVRAILAKKGKM